MADAGLDFAGRHAIAVNYHFVRKPGQGRFQLRAHERPERFDQQLAWLRGRFELCQCRDLADSERDLPAASVVLTFDDGARDVADTALPLLARVGVGATIFVCSRPYIEGRLLDIQRIEFLMQELGVERFRRAFYAELESRASRLARESLEYAGGYRFYRYDEEPIRQFKLDLNYQLPYADVEEVLDVLFANTFGRESEAEAIRETYLGLDELKRLVDAGMEIGTHTHHHRVLPRLGAEAQRVEIETNVAFLREIVGDATVPIAYPFGFHDESTRRSSERLGLSAGFAGERRMITPRDLRERWAIPRYDVNDCFDRSTNAPSRDVFSQLECMQ